MLGRFNAFDEILLDDIAAGFKGTANRLANYHPTPEYLADAAERDAWMKSPEAVARRAHIRELARQEHARMADLWERAKTDPSLIEESTDADEA